ncbi:Stk1 family PASTA domain-containing Ser/Thr kinase [Agathobaculum sp.]|uniref:Stk1 family PASTA domain-containing Ser/Thr kinase n=1 Tax=Agathobaculum sp. TaxID=2048138 RepID=UPI002A810547|nr:Stk1 family PASTA domain-containing Ser/Thr kinase [Agathobaculum sp.]MDY3618104.1 Stk1 family PASTA domain-containing Ser/Thr kinase [Agathobaculum sp.]
MDKYIGKLLGGRYEIIDVVGVGGMAIVYRARCHVLNRYVAVKILKDEYAKDADIRRRFSIESQAVAKLSHHNIVSVYDVGNDGGVDYIVMELMEGVTLKEYLQKKGHLSWQESLFFAQQIARALVHAHSRGIIHQDIKPQNVIILRDGTAKLTDFGIASFATTQETRVVQEAIGSVHYISPEQAKGSTIDYRTDIYSLGVVMYEMLTGKLPFEGETAIQVVMQHLNAVPLRPSEMQPGIPAGMDDIVMHAMCANISKRYATADELYADLERLKNNEHAQFTYERAHGTGETQVLGPEVQQAARRTPVSAERDRNAAPRRSQTAVREKESFFDRLGERPALAAGIAVAVFAVIALIVAGALILTGGGGEKVKVPTFVGQYIDDVMENEEWTGNFTLKEAPQRVESTRPLGEILEQDIDSGKSVAKGAVITLTVSAGGDQVDNSYSIPTEFKGQTLEYVQTVLQKYDIPYKVEEEFSEDILAGGVIRTSPEAGEKLKKGETLILYVSKGKEIKETEVPNLYGQTKSAAEKMLTDAGLKLGSVNEVESDAAVGTVVWQSANKGSKVSEGAEISIQIAKAKEAPPDTPDNPDDPNQGGTDDPGTEPPAPTTGTASIPVVAPEDTESAHIVITLDGEVLFDAVREMPNGSVIVQVTGPLGSHQVQVSVDGASAPYTATFN